MLQNKLALPCSVCLSLFILHHVREFIKAKGKPLARLLSSRLTPACFRGRHINKLQHWIQSSGWSPQQVGSSRHRKTAFLMVTGSQRDREGLSQVLACSSNACPQSSHHLSITTGRLPSLLARVFRDTPVHLSSGSTHTPRTNRVPQGIQLLQHENSCEKCLDPEEVECGTVRSRDVWRWLRL